MRVQSKSGDKVTDDSDLQARLTAEQYAVTQRAATERPFSGALLGEKRDGVYRCLCCGRALFDASTKFESGTGWPSFYQPLEEGAVGESTDHALGTERVEVHCAECSAHLGHVFEDGPRPTGLRYCLNSAALDFEPA